VPIWGTDVKRNEKCYEETEYLFYNRKVAVLRLDEIVVYYLLTEPFRLLYALGFTHSLTQMSTRDRKKKNLGRRARPLSEANNLTANCEPIMLRQYGLFNFSQT
jgi:hypothetical protein